jgi:streptogramin lyase
MKAGQVRNEKRSQAAVALVAIVLLLLTVFSGLALAEGDQGENPESASLVIPDSMQELEALTEGGQQVDADPSTNPAAAEELPLTDLDRAEAENLLVSVFPSALEEQAGVFNDLEVEAFRSDHVAVVPPDAPGAEPGLLSSLLPLRTENEEGTKEPVSLDLEEAGSTLEPANPLVEVQIPTSLDQGISLPETGVSIDVQGSTDRSASVVSDAGAFYPNVAEESDLTVVPTPTGVETLTQLRSTDSPTSQTFSFNFPAGATLHETEDGGAAVTRDGEPLIVVRPPSAIDAEGEPVPVRMEVTGSNLVLNASPTPDAALPILVDPVFESYTWMNNNNHNGIYTDWLPASTNEAILKPSWIGVWNTTSHAGLNLRSYPGSIASGSQATWNYYVPRFFTDFENINVKERPTTYIRNMTLAQVYFLIEEASPHTHPFMLVGLWDENKGAFASIGTHNSAEGQYSGITLPTLTNSGEYTDVKNGGISLTTFESTSYPRQAFVGSATVEISDKDSPGFGELGSVSQWVNAQSGAAINYKITDPGLGIYQLRLRYPAAGGGSGETTTSIGCTGTAGSPCPRTASTATKQISYDPTSMSQGENWVKITGTDPVNHSSTAGEARIKVDHEAPSLNLSGNLTEQATVGAKLPKYTLNYTAKDGDDAAAAAMTPAGAAGTGAGQLERPMGVAVDESGSIFVVDRINNRVVKYNANGTYVSQFGSTGSGDGQFNDPRGIAIAPDGTIWVADLGNDRIQAFSPSGTFLRKAKFTDPASEPYAIATGPGGVLWITDIGLHRLIKLTENPITNLLSTTGVDHNVGTALITPTAVATDEFGNVWVADGGLGKVLEFDQAGKWLFQFGSGGPGDGQIDGIVGLAISPAGNIAITERNNSRVQLFKPDGSYLRKFGTSGSGSGQFFEAAGLSFGPENRLVVADAGNKRITRWSHADQDPQSGVAKVEVKVDGTVKSTNAPGCTSKNCSISSSWTLNADEYTVGTHKVETVATDGVGLQTTKSLNVETHGDRTAPTVTVSGTITEQATLGQMRPAYTVKVQATDPGPAAERKSGVAKIEILVDEKVKDSVAPGCPSEGCSLNREWTLNSSSEPAGWHWLEIRTTDAAGKVKTTFREFTIKRDESAPEFQNLSAFYTAPSGWVEQDSYEPKVDVVDGAGYGVTSVQLKIDGQVVQSATQSCPAGACSRQFGYAQPINMAGYAGGAHPAELIATDGAGNTKKRTWTVNVDPQGVITTGEAEDTVEAAQATSEMAVLSAPPGESSEPTFITQGETLNSVRAPVESSLAINGGEFELDTADGTFTMDPQALGGNPAGISAGSTAAVEANAAKAVDTIVRPIYDGAMTFQAIREQSATEQFSWIVKLEPDQSLKLMNDQFAQVFTDETHPSLGIMVGAAHDAVGSTVPTTLSVAGDLLTLTVHHHAGDPSAGGASFTYPITSGVGWAGGFTTYNITMPPGEEPSGNSLVWMSWGAVSAPEPISSTEDPEASASNVFADSPELKQHFIKVYCTHDLEYGVLPRGGQPEYEEECGNPFQNVHGRDWVFREAFHGKFFNNQSGSTKDRKVWHEGSPTDSIGCVAEGDGAKQENPATPFRRGRVDRCVWWGETKDGGGKEARWGKHITPVLRAVAEERAGCGDNCGRPNPWVEHDMAPMAYYLWASQNYVFHETACIDCS